MADHYEKTDTEPMRILRARHDIEKDTEILTRYWHKKEDAWQKIFVCECCACTNHTGHMPDPRATAETTAEEETAPLIGHLPSKRLDLNKENHEPTQDNLAGNKQEYPDSEIDAWDWDELEASPPQEPPTQLNLQQYHLQYSVTKGLHGTLDTTASWIMKQISRTTRVHYP